MSEHVNTIFDTVEHPNLIAALAGFHAEAPKVVKDATAKVRGEGKDGQPVHYTYGYADLATVTEALNPLLGKHGLAFTSKPTMTPGGFGLVYALKHESGESDEGFWPLPDPTRMKPQDLGSWITYWRRYAFLAVTNTFPSGEDDDGAKASSRERWEDAQPRTQQAPDRHRLAVREAPKDWSQATDEEIFRLLAPFPKATDVMKMLGVYDWMAARDLHKRVVGMDHEGVPVEVTATDLVAGRLADEAQRTDITYAQIQELKDLAAGRGLMKIQVSETETLDQVLYEAGEQAAYAQQLAAGELPPEPQGD